MTVESPHIQREDRLVEGSDDLDCRLCRKKNTAKPTLSPTTVLCRPTKYPTRFPTSTPSCSPTKTGEDVEQGTIATSGTSTTSNTNNGHMATFVGIGIDCSVLLFGIVAVLYWKPFAGRKRKKSPVFQ